MLLSIRRNNSGRIRILLLLCSILLIRIMCSSSEINCAAWSVQNRNLMLPTIFYTHGATIAPACGNTLCECSIVFLSRNIFKQCRWKLLVSFHCQQKSSFGDVWRMKPIQLISFPRNSTSLIMPLSGKRDARIFLSKTPPCFSLFQLFKSCSQYRSKQFVELKQTHENEMDT